MALAAVALAATALVACSSVPSAADLRRIGEPAPPKAEAPVTVRLSVPNDPFVPATLWRAQAYAGAQRPAAEVATVFTTDDRPRLGASTLCAVDGLRFEQAGTCASVVYLLPGEHELTLVHRVRTERIEASVRVRVDAGRTYQLKFASMRSQQPAAVQVLPTSLRFQLTYRSLAPALAAGSPRADEAVPYGAN